MLLAAAPSIQAQEGEDRSGTYYIANYNNNGYNSSNPSNNYYLCPSKDMYDANGEMPFLTTYKERTTATSYPQNSRWEVVFVKTENKQDYYYLRHKQTGKYLTWNDPLVSSNVDRVRVHLQAEFDEENALFYFTEGNKTEAKTYNISPKNYERKDGASLNPAKDNMNFYEGKNQNNPGSFTGANDQTVYCGGLIGVWSLNDVRGVWIFEEIVTRPTITLNGSGQVEIAYTETGTVIHYTTDGTTPTASSPTYSVAFAIPAGTKTIKAIAVRTADSEVSNVATLHLTATFHVVNKQNAIALSYSGTITALASVPAEIRSPYIPDDAGYKLFSTQADAYAYTTAVSDADRSTAADAATTITADGQTVYVGYHYDEAQRPADDLPVLDGSRWYQMMHHHSNVVNYFYSNLNANHRPENSNIATTTSADGITGSNYLWHFTGNDPYGVGLANKAINDVGATTTPGEWLVKQNANITSGWYRTVDGYHADNGASMVMLRHDDDSYNLAIVSDASKLGNYQYLFFFGANNTNVCFFRNDKNTPTSPLYASDRAGCRLSFSEATADYTFHIVDRAGRIAISHTVTGLPVGMPLNSYTDIPEAIRSHYLEGETVSFYSFSDSYSTDKINADNQITETPLTNADIYVTYTADHLMDKFLHLRGIRIFNITANGHYLYNDNGTLSTASAPSDTDLGTLSYKWTVRGLDPYAVQVVNADGNLQIGYDTTTGSLTLQSAPTDCRFILIEGSSRGDGTYGQMELMAATGNAQHYTLSRTDDDGLTLGTAEAAHADALQVRIYTTKRSVEYWLIDKAGELIEGPIANTSEELLLPDEWRSPLVSTYHFHKTATVDANGIYTVGDEITSLIELGNQNTVYVTYDAGNALDIEGGTTYLLKFAHGTEMHQEDGKDYIETRETEAIYPYNNGDHNLFVHGQEQWQEQLAQGASTRARWLWYLVSHHNGTDLTGSNVDPYHVVVKSYSNQSTKVGDVTTNGNTYLYTYKPSEDVGVTTGVISDHSVVTEQPTEYMLIGSSVAHMKLKTRYEVEGQRRIVDRFEHYWKNNPLANKLLKDGGEDRVTANEEDVTLTAAQRSFLESAQPALNKDAWHSYEAWAYAAPWAQRTDGSVNKRLEKKEHWFQTVGMGTGDFTVEAVELAPVLILLDQHGWEIVRIVLPHGPDDPDRAARYAALHQYNSPMVERYHYWKTGEKVSGYHKYVVSNYAIDGEGNEYTTEELGVLVGNNGNLPDYATQGLEAGKERDWYVTYDVKSHYATSYVGAATETATIPSSFLLKQGGSYATTTDGETISTTGKPTDMDNIATETLWLLQPNFNIDREMGYKYAGEDGAQDGALSKAATDQENYDEERNGFDPYNLQIRNKAYPQRYLTANTTGSRLSGGAWAGTSSALTLEYYNQARQTATSYDHVKPSISNTTFMVIDDGNGNMRLMPRFDNTTVMTSFTMLAAQNPAAEAGDPGDGTQTITFGTTTKEAHSTDEILDMTAEYKLAADFRIYNPIGTSTNPFKGTIDGQLYVIEDVTESLVGHADGATIKNVMLDNVTISGSADGNVGAICNEAKGATRIYNCGILATKSTVAKDESGYDYISSCSSTVSGTNHVGGIVGLLDGEARVINCFSYANVSGGSFAGGIVGYNNVATTATNLKTMVMNCMFYGEVSGTSIAPIYNGKIITNDGDANGVNNFNYFRLESSYIENTTIPKVYNCALGAETRFLQRFEFYRHLLNSNRELAAWWATGGTNNKNEMMKWVLEPSQIGSSAPYPILKAPYDDDSKIIKYNSVVNIDAKNAPLASERNKGGKMGTLSVTIQSGNGGEYFSAPSGASITKFSLDLNITDKDFDHFNFNYYKVQLPYYNEVGTGNYTGNRVVTGWKITSITGGTPGTFSTSTADAPSYNFADRNCTNKDLYSTSHRVFNQGAYWDVPEGVTSITIEPYWGKAVYLSDAYWDVTYQNNNTDAMATAANDTIVGGGQRYGNGKTFNSQTVYTAIGDAIAGTALYAGTNEKTYSARSVYDYAVVLVGNYHHISSIAGGGTPYTLTSVDLDGDNEPDYSLMLRFNGRTVFHPVRYDFLNLVGLGMAQKTTGGTGSYNFGIMQPKYWFEVTNTALLRVTQFEYDRSDRGAVPHIVQGGVIEQWVSGQSNGAGNKTTYFHVGGNVWFKEFHRGTHQDQTLQSKHPPVSVTGGDYDEFYLTGLYTANVTSYEDNAECYINGGRFGVVAGAAMEGIGKADGEGDTGNITWQVQNADIKEFYAGGINAAKPVTGNLSTTITGGKIDLYCGGPKFGDMSTGKTVTTNATDCIFGTFFGAGYGGNSYSRQAPRNHNNIINFPHNDKEAGNHQSWNDWLDDYYKQSYNATYGGVSTQFSYQFLPMSGNVDNCARIFVEYVKFSLATTHNVTSTLTGCTITNNFYGGGSLGKVNGPVTSTLNGCTVMGNVFGAGYSASLPTVEVDNIGFGTEPFYYTDLGTYRKGVKSGTVTYTWQKKDGDKWVNNKDHILYTTEDLTTLGTVAGKVTLTITGDETYIGGNVFGGGDESSVGSNTTVSINAGKTLGNVYGGGNVGSVGTFTKADATYIATHPEVAEGKPIECTEGGKTTVTISGTAEIGRDGMSMTAAGGPDDCGHVFGAGRGTVDPLYNDATYRLRPITDTGKQAAIAALEANNKLEEKLTALEMLAYVNETEVTVSEQAFVKGSVYGGSENGHVLGSTWVKIAGGQVGCGRNTTERFPEAKFAPDYTLGDDEDMECSHWDYTYPYRPHDIFAGTEGYDSKDGHKISSDGHTFYGNVFGGGSGYYPYAPGRWLRSAGRVEGNTKVEVTGGHILTSLYGGNEMTDVEGFCEIIMSGGTLGVPRSLQQIQEHPVTCYVFGAGKGDQRVLFNQWTNVDSTKVTIKGTARIYGSVFGGGEDGHVLGNAKVTIGEKGATNQPTIGNWGTSYVDGNIFGGGRGFGGDALTSGSVCGNVTIDILGGNMLGSIYGGGRLGSVGTFLVPATITDPNDPTATIKNPRYGQMISDGWEQVIGGDSIEATGVTHGHITINISGGTIGNTLEYKYYAPTDTIDKNADNIPLTEFDYRNNVLYTKGGNVFTGCMGRLDALDGSLLPNWKDMAKAKSTTLNITGGTIKSNVYGGAELGTVEGNTTVNIKGGTIGTKVVNPEDATQYYYYGSVFGGGKGSTEAIADKYPVGTDEALKTDISKAGQVGGNVAVNLNNGVSNTAKGGIVHKIFGCNDTNGSPLGSVTVHVYKTQNEAATTITNPAEGAQVAKVRGRYDVEAVYGGGNLASYLPTDGTKVAKVIIDGCDETSIETVYGGGNAASTPGTHVEVNASYEIGTIFGGGNGKDLLPSGGENPGAHVGYKADGTTSYGTGRADVQLKGGTIHSAFGGSNTKGNVRVKATVDLSEPEDGAACPLVIEEVYGAGNEAEQDGTAEIILGCLSYLKEIYGGAKNADIDSDVTLTIRSGRFDRVFGGNNLGGKISGTITVNIEETGCHPIIIGQLYGGGNRAAYSVDDIATGRSDLDYEDASAANYYRNFPKVNVRSFTSIGEIYGGGYGAEAVVTGNPFVDINVCEGGNRSNEVEDRTIDGATVSVSKNTGKTITLNAGQADEMQLEIPLHKSDAIGAIGSVFGGGNAANVIGDTHVSIGTKMTEDIVFETPKTKKVTVEGVTSEVSTTAAERTHEVKGADIRGNVFGGGNRANVTGNTDVKVGR